MDKVRYNLTLEKIKKDWQCANTLPQLNEPPSPPFFLMPLRNIPMIKGADTAFPGNRNSFQSPLRKSHPWKEMWILWNGHHSLDSWYKVPCGFFFLVLETVGPMWEGETLYSRQNNTKEMATNDSDRSMPLYKGGPGLKNFFWPFGPQFDPKIRGGGGGGGPLGSANERHGDGLRLWQWHGKSQIQ